MARGGTRLLWAFRRPVNHELVMRIVAGALAPPILLERESHRRSPRRSTCPRSPRDLKPGRGASLLAALLGVWSSAFKLRHDRGFAQSVLALLDSVAANPPAATTNARLGASQMLMTTPLAIRLGAVQAIYEIGPAGIEYARTALAPRQGGCRAAAAP